MQRVIDLWLSNPSTIFFLRIGIYLGILWLSLWVRPKWIRDFLFASINLVAVGHLFFLSVYENKGWLWFGTYVGGVGIAWILMRLFALKEGVFPILAFFFPVFSLVFIKYAQGVLIQGPYLALYFVGISYMAFRLSQLVFEVRNGIVNPPGLFEYLGFAFFVPTLSIGPINPYSTHSHSLNHPSREVTPFMRSAFRVVVGGTKYFYFSSLLNQITFGGLIKDDHPHLPIDLLIASVAYYLYLYFNFSGFCDMAIGGAGLIGIRVRENFNNPFVSRNVKDFWNRWHITLSEYMRDVAFTPLSKALVRKFGPDLANHAIAFSIFFTFVIVGVWHGVGWNYFLFGLAHAFGVVVNHYYTLLLKKTLPRERFKAYNQNRAIHCVSVGATFVFVSISFFLFANDLSSMKGILNAIRW